MLKLEGSLIKSDDLPKYEWYADLVYFDGPLISLFKGEKNTDAIYMWVDNDSRRNRWCIIPVNRDTLNNYIRKEIALKDVISLTESVVFFNISEGVNGIIRRSFTQVNINDFPPEYLPDDDSFLSDLIATPEAVKIREDVTESYMLGIDNELYTEDLSNIPYLFQQLYSFHYSLDNLAIPSVRDRIIKLLSSWTGGISSVNIFTGMRGLIPTIHRPQVQSIKYNSPGHIELNLLPRIAKDIEISMERSLSDIRFNRMDKFYKRTYLYLKENNISGFDDFEGVNLDAIINDDTKKNLTRRVTIFMKLFGWPQYQVSFDSLGAHPLQQIRTILAYYRRFKKLRCYVTSDNLSIGSSKIPNWH
ncbi:TPA: hypothetical protein ACS7XE_003698 [Providencia alcalifaciens]